MKYFFLALILTMSLSITNAQTSNIIHLNNKTIEVIGLEHWTVKMIQDSLNKYSPGDSLQSHACAAILRFKLHFADAAVMVSFPDTTDYSKQYVLVSVVEPEDSVMVHYRKNSIDFDSLSIKPEWKLGINMIIRHPMGFQAGLSLSLMNDSAKKSFNYSFMDTTGVASFEAFLKSHSSSLDGEEARSALRTDLNTYDQMIAAAILTQFSEDDSTWWSLLESQLDSRGPVPSVAQQVLWGLAAYKAHPINWVPEASTIHSILDGTDLFSLPAVCNALTRTGANPKWAKAFLRDGGRMLLAYAGAQQEYASKPALKLLRELSGKDYGNKIEFWRKWIGSL